MNYAEALRALDARIPTRMVPDLDRMRALSELLAHPQRTYPSIHITGTNGKTTTAWVATELLRATGLSVGTFTSPHLHHVRERIAFDGEPISEEEFAQTYSYLEPFLAEVDAKGEIVTYFETLTMLAQVWFAERSVDAAVFEVGMGGEWDATNLIDGRVAVITEVALDHPELGATPVEIAREKVGIIKQAAVCVTGERSDEVRAVIEERCNEMGAILRVDGTDFAFYGRDNAVGGQALDLSVAGTNYEQVFVPVYGEKMATDVLLGVAAVSAFLGDRELDQELVRGALAGLRSPGRIEVLRRRPLLIVDGAHNPAAALELANTVQDSFACNRLILVLGILGDKDVEGVVAELVPMADDVIATTAPSTRAAPAERIAKEAARLGVEPRIVSTVEGAVAQAIELAGDGDLILIAGSFTTAAEARAAVLGLD
ncbi:MAG TPA: folylpolyglutamate synthase/dihydrofolate synthase family protein [Actinomycetota bacterium]|nr:folylpolyglutamate synthase/dihydrofolate synthase family protein [Actinomycetota bacterium]